MEVLMSRKFVLLLVFVALFLAACQAAAPEEVQGKKIDVTGGSYTDVSVAELQSLLKNKDFTFVNVHIPYAGDIPDTDIFIPFDEIAFNLDKLPADKNAKIVLYCRSDRMSGISAETLAGLGYTNVWNVDGGMVAWEQAGLELEFK
jgi:rhodanese-related sulfurtransferase